MNGILTISEADLAALIARRVEEVLSPARLEAMALARVEERIGMVTLDEAARRLGKPNRKRVTEFCRRYRIPVHEFSREDRFILVKDLEAALQKRRVVLPTSGTGTRVGEVEYFNDGSPEIHPLPLVPGATASEAQTGGSATGPRRNGDNRGEEKKA